MQKFNFNKSLLSDLNPNSTGSLGINISPINEQKKLEDEQRKKEEQRLKLQNLADTFYMIGANQSGDTQRMAFHSNRLAQRKAEQEARQLKAQQDMQRRNYFGGNQDLLQFAEIMGDKAAYAEKLRLDALENQRIKNQNFNSVAQGIKRDDYESNREYYQALGMGYLNKGYNEEARKFLEMGKPQTPKDYSKDILSERKVIEKQYTPVKENVQNFQKLDIALQSDSGTGAYSALLLYLKNLDGSVVKAEEVNSFNQMQGILGQIEETLSKTKGDGMTPEMRSQIRNIAAEATNLTLKGYEDYLKGSMGVYTALGLDPELIYGGYTLDRNSYNFNEVDPSFFGKITGALVE
jgi:hypothetical protein